MGVIVVRLVNIGRQCEDCGSRVCHESHLESLSALSNTYNDRKLRNAQCVQNAEKRKSLSGSAVPVMPGSLPWIRSPTKTVTGVFHGVEPALTPASASACLEKERWKLPGPLARWRIDMGYHSTTFFERKSFGARA